MSSLWAKYRHELDGEVFIEIDTAFVGFKMLPAWDHVIITDIYVEPELRKSGLAKRLVREVCKIAREAGKKYLIGGVDVAAKTAATSLQFQLALGLVPFATENGRIWMRIELSKEF